MRHKICDAQRQKAKTRVTITVPHIHLAMGMQFLESKKMTKEINSYHQTILIEEVSMQSHLTILAHNRLLDFIRDERNYQNREVWIHIQSVLSHSAMISKYLAPGGHNPSSRAKKRAKSLKDALCIGANSPLLKRTVRNNVEHLDERFDDWMEADGGRFLECVFESREGLEYMNPTIDGVARWFIRRVYLIDGDTFVSQGREGIDEINLAALICEVRRIKRIAELVLSSSS